MSSNMNSQQDVSYWSILIVALRFLFAAIRGAASGSTIPTGKRSSGKVQYRVACGRLGSLDITQRWGRTPSRSNGAGRKRSPASGLVSTSTATTPVVTEPPLADASFSRDGREMRSLNSAYDDLR